MIATFAANRGCGRRCGTALLRWRGSGPSDPTGVGVGAGGLAWCPLSLPSTPRARGLGPWGASPHRCGFVAGSPKRAVPSPRGSCVRVLGCLPAWKGSPSSPPWLRKAGLRLHLCRVGMCGGERRYRAFRPHREKFTITTANVDSQFSSAFAGFNSCVCARLNGGLNSSLPLGSSFCAR